MTGQRHGEIHEQLADTGALHEAAEQHEDQHVGRGYRERNAENAFRRHVELIHQPHRLEPGDEQAIDQKHDGGDRQRPTDHAARGLEHDQHHDRAHDHVGPREVVDVEDASGEVFVVDEQVDDRCRPKHKQRVIENAGQAILCPIPPIDQEGEHQREQQVGAPERDRLRRAEGDRPHVVRRHRD
jgi:hypothetical protein